MAILKNFSMMQTLNSLHPLSIFRFHAKIKGYLGTKFFLMLSYMYYFSKGLNYIIIAAMMTPYFLEHGLPPDQNSYNQTVAMLPWSMKGFFGVASDIFPLFGYSKTSYLVLFYTLGTVAAVVLLVLPDSVTFSLWQLPGILLFFTEVPMSAGDLLTEGKYVEKMKQMEKNRGDIVTYVWWCQIFVRIIPPLIIGAISETVNLKWTMVFVAPIHFCALPLLFTGCMVDDKVPAHMKNKIDVKKFKRFWKIMIVGLLMGGLALLLAVLFTASYETLMYISVIGSLLLCVAVYFALPKRIAKAVIYLFLATATYGNTGGISTYWYFEEHDCANGPKLNYQQVIGLGSLIGTFAQLIGIWGYSVFFSKMPLRLMFWSTTALRIASGFLFIVWLQRWNLAIGLSDFVFFVFGDTVVPTIVYMMDFMPTNILIAKLCPKSVEVTVYAIMAGFSNFGQAVAAYYSIPLSLAFNIPTVAPNCDFSKLTLLYSIGAIFIPLVQIPLVFVLIPKGYIDDDLLDEESKALDKAVNEYEAQKQEKQKELEQQYDMKENEMGPTHHMSAQA